MKRKSAAQKKAEAAASRRWRERHPDRAKKVERDAYHRRQAKLGKNSIPRVKLTSEERRAKSAARVREWRRRNLKRSKAQRKRNYERNREQQCARSRDWYRRNKERALLQKRVYHLQARYGLTAEQAAALGTVCSICGAAESGVVSKATGRNHRMHIDHDHDSGRVRGLLCNGCNCGIGYFKHDIKRMKKAIAYLESTKR